MDSATFLAALSAAVAIVVAALTAGSTYLLTKKRELEADWRKMKLDIYKDYVAALSRQMSDATALHTDYIDAINAVSLVAPSDVLNAVYEFTADAFIEHSGNQKALIQMLLTALRRDTYSPLRHKSENFELRLYNIPGSQANGSHLLAGRK